MQTMDIIYRLYLIETTIAEKKVILILMPGTETAVKYGQLHVADVGYSSAAGL